jgi:hypothetical protein
MKIESNQKQEKDNRSYLEANPRAQRSMAFVALAKAKELEAKQIASGKKWQVSPCGKTSWLCK